MISGERPSKQFLFTARVPAVIFPDMADTVYCSKCGAPSAAGAVFCQGCGSRMVTSATPLTTAPAATAVATATYPATPYSVTPYPVTPVMPDSYYGGFWIRLAAHLIDHVVFGAVFVPAFFIFLFPAIIATYHDGYDGEPPVRLIVSGV